MSLKDEMEKIMKADGEGKSARKPTTSVQSDGEELKTDRVRPDFKDKQWLKGSVL